MGINAAPCSMCNMDVPLWCMGVWLNTGREWGLASRGAILLCESLPGKEPQAVLSMSLLTLPSTHQISSGNLNKVGI